MRFSTGLTLLAALATSVSASPLSADDDSLLTKRAIPTSVYNDLVFYFQYASSVYQDVCARPNGNTLVTWINETVTDTQGFIVQDDARREIVVVFRGSTSRLDFETDGNVRLTDFVTSGVSAPAGARVHTGWLTAWNAVSSGVISTVRSQLATRPDYTIVTSGHSLGGSLSTLAGISLKQNFPTRPLRLYNYGAPMVGNSIFANFVNQVVGPSNAFRGIHTTDGAPYSIPQILNYAHHGTEYWTFADPSSAENTKQCDPSGTDPTCSASAPSDGTSGAHLTYYDIRAGTTFCS